MTPDKPWLSIVVTCIGRMSLGRLLDSIPEHQGIEVLVVPDTHVNDEADFTAAIRETRSIFEHRVRWLEHDAGYHNWGHPQRDYGDSMATGEWLLHSQDDNVFHPSAFTDIWFAICAQAYPRPILFKVHTWQSGTIWKVPRVTENNIDADMMVCPNIPSQLGKWGDRYAGDADFIFGTTACYEEVDFNPSLIQWHGGKDNYSLPEFRKRPNQGNS